MGRESVPDSNNLREMWGAKATALDNIGHSTRSTMRQKPPTVASDVTEEFREDAVECDDDGWEDEWLAGSSVVNTWPKLCIK